MSEGYIKFDQEKYLARCRELFPRFLGIQKGYGDLYSCGPNCPRTEESYLVGHLPRFLDGIRAIEDNVTMERGLIGIEAGSGFPWYTLHFSDALDWTIDCMDIATAVPTPITTKVISRYGNLCTDDIGHSKYDIATCCEVWEHLPCNLNIVKSKLITSLKPGAFLLCSYPCGGVNASMDNYSKDWDTQFNKHHGHLREFTEDLAKQFIIEMKMVFQTMSHPPAYGNCYTILYRKE